MQDKEVILDVRSLQTHFKNEGGVTKAVDQVSFKLKKGETLGIVGESGSGKSVTSLSLMRLIKNPPGRIVGGEMLFNSQSMGQVDIAKLNDRDLRKLRGNEISMIFQEPMTSLNPVFTCGFQVMEVLMLHKKIGPKEAQALTIELFKKVKLPRPEAIFKSYPHQISGGQKQRVMIAMAIACKPQILIADEPTTALDVTVQATILDLLRQLRDENDMSIIFITHDLGVIAEIADRVMVMYHGQVVEEGPVFDIFDNPQHPYTKGLLSCRPRLDLRLKVLPVVSDFMHIDSDGNVAERKGVGKYSSITDAILQNYITKDEVDARNKTFAANEVILEVKNLKTYFPSKRNLFGKVKDYVRAVDDVSFKVHYGETIGLVGESGCGKTTLGRSILHLTEPTSGEIYFHGKDINIYSREELRCLRRDLQIIFQDPYSSLNPRMTVGEAIVEPMMVHGVLDNFKERKEMAIELLEKVNLKAMHFNRYPHEFSGGQRQRICIARALALHPSFIICDESVSALDVSVQAQVLNLLNKLKEEFQFTSIFISHDLSVVKFISDRILVMCNGQVVESGYSDELYENPQQEYTRRLIDSIPKGRLEDIKAAQLKRALN